MAKQLGNRKYRRHFAKQLVEMFDKPPYTIVYSEGSNTPKSIPSDLPLLEKFASFIGVTVEILYEWGEQYSEFAEALVIAKQYQLDFVTNAIKKNYDSSFSESLLRIIFGGRMKNS